MDKTEQLIIVGAGEFAEIAYEYFTYDSRYEVVAFSVESAFLQSAELFGLPVVPFEELAQRYDAQTCKVFVAVTSTQLNRVRTRLYQAVKAKGFTPISYISSKAFVWRNVEIGENCFIFENNVLQHHVKVGNNVILWSGNHLGHRSTIRENCFISSHVTISGYCDIGENCFLGVNSCIANNLTVAKDCFIGAGAVILKDTEPGKIYKVDTTPPSAVSSLRMFKVKEA